MSKKLYTLIQSLALVGTTLATLGQAKAENMTVEIYENGRNAGTMTIPANQYQNLANRMNGTGVTVRPQPRPDAAARQQAAEQRMAEWQKQNAQRHQAALEQQERWKQGFERRHLAAQQGFDAWKRSR